MAELRAVIYARYSSSSQREESIEGQIRDCTAYAERNGYMVIGTYADRALSGTTDNRPEFQKMIKDSKRKQFDLVIVTQGTVLCVALNTGDGSVCCSIALVLSH